MMQHINTLPTPPALINQQLPLALSEVILRAMAKDTATRYPMASLLATAIADACSIPSTLTLPPLTTIAEEESAYSAASGQYSRFLGVSQPAGPTRPVAQQFSHMYTNPSIPAATTSGPLIPDTLGKQRIASPTPAPITKKIPTPLPNTSLSIHTAPQPARTTPALERPTLPSSVT